MDFKRGDYLLLFFILILWAGNIIAVKLAVTEIPPMTAATLRFFLAALVFLPFLQKPDRRTLWYIFQISMLMNVIHIGLLFIALRMLDAASVSILLQTQVIFATVLGMIFFHEKIRWRTWTGIGLAVAGIAIMCGEPDLATHPTGVAIMLVSTLSLAYSFIKMKHLQSVHPATYICLLSAFSLPFNFAASLVLAPGSWAALPDANWLLLGPLLAYQSVVISITHIIWQRMLHRGNIGNLTAFTMLTPFITVLLAVLILGEHIDIPMIVGGLVTMLGVAIITFRRIQKGIAAPEESDRLYQ